MSFLIFFSFSKLVGILIIKPKGNKLNPKLKMKNLSWVHVMTHPLTLLVSLVLSHFTWIENSKIENTNPSADVIPVTLFPDVLISKGIDSLPNQGEQDAISTTTKITEVIIKKETSDSSTSSKSIVIDELELYSNINILFQHFDLRFKDILRS